MPEELLPILESRLKSFKGMKEEQLRVLDGVTELLKGNYKNTVSRRRYKETLTFLLYAEEYQVFVFVLLVPNATLENRPLFFGFFLKAEKDLEQFDMYSSKLKRSDEGGATLEVPGLIDRSPNVLKGKFI